MLSVVQSATVVGIDAQPVQVEVDVTGGTLAVFDLVGLPEASVREARVRVKNAIAHAGLHFPQRHITVNLAPADLRKTGCGLDLPVALGVLGASGALPQDRLDGVVAVGELSLTGEIRPVPGLLCVAELCGRIGVKRLLCATENHDEAAAAGCVEVVSARDLAEAVACLNGKREWPRPAVRAVAAPAPHHILDWSDVKGQLLAKRALEIAAAGAHNVLLVGPPGTGKTMLARRLPTILPDLTREESLESTRVWSVAGLLGSGHGLLAQRPFRAPHHTTSPSALVGGGPGPRPGEISLAHNGVLFLDELPEFPRVVIEALRTPIEDGRVVVARVRQSVCFPCRFMLIGSMNPCPCGYANDPRGRCRCREVEIARYRSRVSGPLLDRVDLQVELPALSGAELHARGPVERSVDVRGRVERARRVQALRFSGASAQVNARITPAELRARCPLSDEATRLLRIAIDRFGLSPRAHDRVWRIARTIADLGGSLSLDVAHIAEALQYRRFDEATGVSDEGSAQCLQEGACPV